MAGTGLLVISDGAARTVLIRSHQLRREIVTTSAIQRLGGCTSASMRSRIAEDVGVTPIDCRAHLCRRRCHLRCRCAGAGSVRRNLPIALSDRLTAFTVS